MRRWWTRHGWWALGVLSLILLGILLPILGFQLPELGPLLLGTILITGLMLVPFPIGASEVSLAHAITLAMALTSGLSEPSFALLLGFIVSTLIRALQTYAETSRFRRLVRSQELQQRAHSLTRQLLSLLIGFAAFRTLGGVPLTRELQAVPPSALAGFGALFTLTYLAIYRLSIRPATENGDAARRSRTSLWLAVLFPIPLALVTAVASVQLGLIALVVTGTMVLTLSWLVRRLSRAQSDLERRLQELSTLNRVSQTMRASLDLESILTTIQLQVSHLLEVENFYVALVDPDSGELTYPLAIKNGIRQSLPRRQLADRLTDRVIRTAGSILISEQGTERIPELEVEASDHAPEAWLGVPLLNPERAIGCMAVFHSDPRRILTEKDRSLLETLASQAATAIENALLYEQTASRADALATLHEITASMGATLDPERAVALVCESMVGVGGAESAAIYLVQSGAEDLTLAKASGLSEDFTSTRSTLPLQDPRRARALQEQTPLLVPDVWEAQLDEEHAQQLSQFGIRAMIDLPLVTPSGLLGVASVYFSEPQQFLNQQVDLLKTLAAQAALAVANARAHAETDQELKRRVEQLSLLEAAGRELAATLNPESLYQSLLAHALELTLAERGWLAVLGTSGENPRIAAAHWPGGEELSVEQSLGHEPAQRALERGELVVEAYATRWPIRIAEGADRTVLFAPIERWGQRIGLLCLERASANPFNDQELQAVRQLTAQAAIALSNAQLYQQLEDRLRDQSLLYQASVLLGAKLEASAVSMAAADSLSLALDCDRVHVYRWDEQQRSLVLETALLEGDAAYTPEHRTIEMSEAPAFATALKEGRSVQWSEATAPSEPDRIYLAEIRQAGSLLALPLRAAEESAGLVEALSPTPKRFSEAELRMAETLVGQVAIALQNADLFVRVQQNHERLLAVLNSTREGMLMIDPSGTVVVANHQLEELIHLPLESVVGRKLDDLQTRLASQLGYQAADLARLIHSLRDGEPIEIEQVALEKIIRGSPRTLQRTETPVRDIAGRLIGWLIVLRDITAERELVEAREHLTRMIVHDLRSPLTTIMTSISLLERTLKDVADVPAQALSIAHSSCQQMLGLVNSLLDIAKMESGELTLAEEEVSLRQLCEEVAGLFLQEANRNGIILRHDAARDLPIIIGDGEKLRRVLINLVDNAIKFTPSGGQVELEASHENGRILIQIRDTGPGVPEHMKSSIFDPFVQVAGADGRRKGTGLGLAFSRLAIEAHGGRIWVEDHRDGGSVFRIDLPAGQLKQNGKGSSDDGGHAS